MTNETKQTTVEWLIKELTPYIMLEKSKANQLIEQAKAMHKTEHFNTWWHGISENEPITFEQYYNETYGGNK